jgi:hypothetical protein
MERRTTVFEEICAGASAGDREEACDSRNTKLAELRFRAVVGKVP